MCTMKTLTCVGVATSVYTWDTNEHNLTQHRLVAGSRAIGFAGIENMLILVKLRNRMLENVGSRSQDL